MFLHILYLIWTEKHDNYERITLVYKLKRDTVVHFISDGLENQILFYWEVLEKEATCSISVGTNPLSQ